VVNAALIGVAGLWFRSQDNSKLLGIARPSINKRAEQQFGPYAYRSNAIQYFSMIWPLGLGLATTAGLARSAGSARAVRSLLLVLSLGVSILPLLTRSRMGAIVGTGALVGAVPLLMAARWRLGGWARWSAATLIVSALGVGLSVGWSRISYRIAKGNYFEDSGRTDLREAGWQMVQENPVFGTGSGTFATLYQLYRRNKHRHLVRANAL